MSKNKNQLSRLIWITNIFEKEIVIFIYYTLFTFISFSDPKFNMQFIFFGIGTFLQIFLKAKGTLKFWNNFLSTLFFLAGSILSLNQNIFFTGFFFFILLIALLSFSYEKWYKNISNKLLSIILNILYSAIVLASFPFLYYIFMKNKLDIDLGDFFSDQNNLLVFSGYFVFYFLLLLNKQLLTLQANILKNRI